MRDICVTRCTHRGSVQWNFDYNNDREYFKIKMCSIVRIIYLIKCNTNLIVIYQEFCFARPEYSGAEQILNHVGGGRG